MPAAAVIPAPIAYIKVVAVKKLVVGFLAGASVRLLSRVQEPGHPSGNVSCSSLQWWLMDSYTLL